MRDADGSDPRVPVLLRTMSSLLHHAGLHCNRDHGAVCLYDPILRSDKCPYDGVCWRALICSNTGTKVEAGRAKPKSIYLTAGFMEIPTYAGATSRLWILYTLDDHYLMRRMKNVQPFKAESLSTQKHLPGILDILLDLDQELHGFPTVQQSVIVCQGEIHHGSNLNLAVDRNGLVFDGVKAKHGTLG